MKEAIHASWCALLCLAAFTARPVTVTNIAADEYHSLLLKSDGSFWGMGNNQAGALGNGTFNYSYAPELILSNGVVRIAGGGLQTLFVKSDGSLWGMGGNFDGELGDDLTNEYVAPKEIVASGVVAIACGGYHSLFLKSDGSLWGMGDNGDGELGNGTNIDQYAPEELVSNGVTAIAGGYLHSLFLKSDGSLWGMGYNGDGELGDGTTTSRYSPEEIVSNGVVAIAAGAYHSLFLKSDGSLWGMGDGTGQTYSDVNFPEQINAITFSANPASGLAPLTVQFTAPGADFYGNPLTSWNWNFGDGGVSTAQNPSHTYVSNGTCSPTLLTTNTLGALVVGADPATILVALNSGIVTNGGFETGSFSGWTAQAGSISTSASYVHSGTYGAQLGPTTLSYLSQTLATTPGETYILSFWLRNNSGANNQFLVSWDGNTLLNLTDLPAGAWSNYAFSVTASSSSTVLEFGYENGPSYFGLDDISVLPATAASPMLGIGKLNGNQLQISWPVSANLELQTTTNLAPPIVWQPLTNDIVTNGDVNSLVVTNSLDGLSHFYRLATP